MTCEANFIREIGRKSMAARWRILLRVRGYAFVLLIVKDLFLTGRRHAERRLLSRW
jgi:hypothetical protein